MSTTQLPDRQADRTRSSRVAYLGVDDGNKYGGIAGKGFLHAGAEVEVPIGRVSVGTEAHFIWVCRDVRGRTHLWSYDERYESMSSRELRKMRSRLGDFFTRMYPDITIP